MDWGTRCRVQPIIPLSWTNPRQITKGGNPDKNLTWGRLHTIFEARITKFLKKQTWKLLGFEGRKGRCRRGGGLRGVNFGLPRKWERVIWGGGRGGLAKESSQGGEGGPSKLKCRRGERKENRGEGGEIQKE